MNLLLEMNRSPSWIPVLQALGRKAAHQCWIGPVDAPDALIMRWAKEHGYCVVTNDLDFSAILAAARAEGPSVIQIRGQDLSPETLQEILVDVLRDHESALSQGAILTVDVRNARVRRLSLRRDLRKSGTTSARRGRACEMLDCNTPAPWTPAPCEGIEYG